MSKNNTAFRFKQFNICHGEGVMKVGTDGVLLGAWSNIKPNRVLDIGCGSGLIAIMCAQRSQHSTIIAIDINPLAYDLSLSNVEKCSWKRRIKVVHSSLQMFKSQEQFDTIITNPPFFSGSFKSQNLNRNMSRHTDGHLSFDELVDRASSLLKKDGLFSIILPIESSKQFICMASKHGLLLTRRCYVKPKPEIKSKRVLMEFSRTMHKFVDQELIIETKGRHLYSKEYITLTKDFYLNL